MTVVLTHLGCTGPFIDNTALPSYLDDCIDQYSIFNKGSIYFITDRANISGLRKYSNVTPIILEDLHSTKVDQLCSLFDYPEKNFWTVALTRFVYIENLMKKSGLEHVYHFENDVMLYFDIAEYDAKFQSLYKNLAITPCDHNKFTTGFMYIKDYHSLEMMTEFFIEVLVELGVEGVKREFDLDMVNEMGLMAAYHKRMGNEYISCLPIAPFGPFSQSYNEFNSVFDPASFGQFVGGTRTEGPGAKPQDHYIGRLLRIHPKWGVRWEVEDSLRVPYFHYEDSQVKINTLHIHSKNLEAFLSRSQDLRPARHTYDEFSSHQPVLYEAVKRAKGDVIEFGCGYGSTLMLHELCGKMGKRLLSLESHKEWIDQFKDYETDWHRFILVEDWEEALKEIDLDSYEVAFIDQDTMEARGSTIIALKDKVKFLVLHDCHWYPEHGFFGKVIRPLQGSEDIGERDYSDFFKYWREWFPSPYPPTLLASNFESCDMDVDFEKYKLALSLEGV